MIFIFIAVGLTALTGFVAWLETTNAGNRVLARHFPEAYAELQRGRDA